jgi:predicted dehydrogenase
MKQVLLSGEIGNILYYDSVRINLGLFQSDTNVFWDLAPHDLAILDYLIDRKPISVAAHGSHHFNKFEDVELVEHV